MNSQKSQRESSGTILLLALIILATVIAIVVEIHILTQNMIRREHTALELSRLRLLAADTIFQMAEKLSSDKNLLYDHTNELWALSYSNSLSDGTKIFAYIIDENRFFDVNNLASSRHLKSFRKPIEILIDILSMNGLNNAIELAQSIQDWVDADQEGVRENPFYLQTNSENAPPNLTMESSAELAFLFRANKVNFSGMPDGLTLLPKGKREVTKININTASEQVLVAVLGVGVSDVVRNILRRREAGAIISLSSVIPSMFIEEAKSFLDVKSDYFSIFVKVEKQDRIVTSYALLYRDVSGRITILRWVEK